VILFYFYLLRQNLSVSDAPKEEAVTLSLSQFVPEAPPAASSEPVQEEQLVEEEPEPEKEIIKEPEPEKEVIEEEPPEEIPDEKRPEEEKPEEPVVKDIPVPEPVKKVLKPVPKKPVKKTAKKKHRKKKKTSRKRQVKGGGSPRYSAAAKNRFLAQIRAKINRAKSYPRVAQKRRMQGIVKVRFTILANGRAGNISLSGPKIFYSSARKAVQKAFPVDIKKAPLRLPCTVNLSLRYKLR
jgi:protein TonB